MHIETEIKFQGVDFEALRERLQRIGAEFQSRELESNLVFDDAAGRLRPSGILLRLRDSGGRAILTCKTPLAPEEGGDENFATAKRRRESETPVSDFAAMREILEALGYRVAFEYEKLRETWRAGGVEVLLDLLPFGNFLEMEGDEDEMRALARSLGLDPGEAITANYHELNRRHRLSAGLPPMDSFVFDAERKRRLAAGERPSAF